MLTIHFSIKVTIVSKIILSFNESREFSKMTKSLPSFAFQLIESFDTAFFLCSVFV